MRRTTIARRTAAAVAVPLLLAGLSACGDNNSDTSKATDPGAAPSSQAAPPTADAGSTIAPSDFVDTIKQSMENSTTAHLEMNMSVGGQSIKATGEVDYSGGGTPKMQMSMTDPTGSGQDLEMRLIGTTMYMKMAAMGDKFVKLDLNDPNSPLGQMSSLTDNMDPRKAMDSFAPALKKVTYVGEETVDGAKLKHYKLVMDPSKITSLKDVGTQLPKVIKYDMWLDDQSRMSKMVMNLGSTMDVSVRYFDWDKPVTITEPAPSEVTEMPSMPGASPSS